MKTDTKTTLNLTYPAIFAALPDAYVLLDNNFKVVAVTDAYLDLTFFNKNDILEKNFFDIFPENSSSIKSNNLLNLRNSFERVCKTKKTDNLGVQTFEISLANRNQFAERSWNCITIPILNKKGDVEFLAHKIEDVTEYVHYKKNNNSEKIIGGNFETQEKIIYQSAQDIQKENFQLRLENDKLSKRETTQQQIYEKLQHLNKIKTSFFSNLGNSLRTPLTLILATINKLKTEKKNHEIRFDIDLISRNTYELLNYVNDIRDISKLETKKIDLYYSNCDLIRIVRHTAALFESHAHNKLITYKIVTPASIPAELDVQKIQRIIVNLLANAFKNTPVGGSVECTVVDNGKTAIIEIADSGPGIPLEMRENLFDHFFNSSNQQTKITTLGLGLIIVKDFIELHGGKILIETSNHGGALFRIELPLKAPDHTKIEHRASDPKLFPRELMPDILNSTIEAEIFPREKTITADSTLPIVLIVEDNVDMNQYISTILESDYQIISAFNGIEGLEKSLQYNPDLILCDLLMPKMDGEQMICEIRSHQELNNTPILVLTAKMDEELSAKLLREGAQDYLVKPFSHQELIARVANHINLKKATQELQRKNFELIEANNELDAFGYSVSHDLRNPIQSILGFCTLLLDAFNLDAEVREYLRYMQNSGKRMEELINDLLILSHSLRHEVNYQKVNLSKLAKDILDDLRETSPFRQMNINIQEDMFANADARLMQIVLENLLNNAWKYTSKVINPSIEFGMQSGEIPTFYIKDNGIGFEQEKAEKLFKPFSRLHEDKDFPGTGVGLATVKRIIEKHGGRVWVRSKPNEGTTFYFQLSS